MGVLATFAAGLRTALAASPASLTALPENVSIDDVPDLDKTIFSVEPTADEEMDNEHGGGTYVMYRGGLMVRIAWQLDEDEEAFSDIKANDLENVAAVVNKVSNWTSGIVIVNRTAAIESRVGTNYRADLIYSVRYRVAQNLT